MGVETPPPPRLDTSSRRRPARVVTEFLVRSRAVLWTSGALATAQVLSVSVALLTSRLLGPAGKGLVNAVTTWSQLLCWVSILGLGTASQVRIASLPAEGPQRREATRIVLGNGVAFAISVGTPVSLVGAIVVARLVAGLGPGAGGLAVGAIAAMPIALLALIVSMVQVGLGHRRIFNYAAVASPAVTMVTIVAVTAVSHLTPGRLVAAYVAGSAFSLIVAGWGLPWNELGLGLGALREDLKFGLRLHAADLLRLTSFRLDVLVMSALVPAAQIGLYGAANSAMMPVLILASGSSTLITARVAQMAAGVDQPEPLLKRQATAVLREARRYSLLSLAGGVVLAMLAPLLVHLVLGAAYRPAVKLIWILLPGYVCLGFSGIIAGGAEGMRRPWVGVAGEASAAALTLVLLPILLPRFGAEGAAIASTAAYAVAAGVCGFSLVTVGRGSAARDVEEKAGA